MCLILCDPMDCSTPAFPCPSPTPRACSNSCPSSRWCHPSISSSVIPFSSCLLSFPGSGSFLMSQFFASGGQSIGASASSLSNEYSGLISFRIDWFDLLAVQGTLKSLRTYESVNVLRTELLLPPLKSTCLPTAVVLASPYQPLDKSPCLLSLMPSGFVFSSHSLLMSFTDILIFSLYSLKSLTTLRQHS